MLSSVRPSVVCNVRAPYSAAVEIFGNVSTPLVTYLGHSLTSIQVEFYGYRPREPLHQGGLNARGVAEYSDFEAIEGYISQTVQDRPVSIILCIMSVGLVYGTNSA